MKPRAEHLVILVAILLAGLLLGGRSVGAVLARTVSPPKVGPAWSNWHGAGPGLAQALASTAAKNALGAVAQSGGSPISVPPAAGAAPYQADTAPTITVDRINAVLQEYNSPAVGTGQAFYDLGVRYGINPAIALAFFIHESSAGTKGVARFTNSVGNIRTTPGYRDYQGYRAYDSWPAGIEDFYKLLRDLYIDGWGLHTVAQILPRYAPAADNNDTDAYVANVQNLIDSWRNG